MKEKLVLFTFLSMLLVSCNSNRTQKEGISEGNSDRKIAYENKQQINFVDTLKQLQEESKFILESDTVAYMRNISKLQKKIYDYQASERVFVNWMVELVHLEIKEPYQLSPKQVRDFHLLNYSNAKEENDTFIKCLVKINPDLVFSIQISDKDTYLFDKLKEIQCKVSTKSSNVKYSKEGHPIVFLDFLLSKDNFNQRYYSKRFFFKVFKIDALNIGVGERANPLSSDLTQLIDEYCKIIDRLDEALAFYLSKESDRSLSDKEIMLDDGLDLLRIMREVTSELLEYKLYSNYIPQEGLSKEELVYFNSFRKVKDEITLERVNNINTMLEQKLSNMK